VASSFSRSQNAASVPRKYCSMMTEQMLWHKDLQVASFFLAALVLLRT
jgi:hypothetical protein